MNYRIFRVDVGGYRLFLECTHTGRPTVLFDAGAGGDFSTWTALLPVLRMKAPEKTNSALPQLCAYDRAGEGLSASGPLPRDSRRIVLELHALLKGAHIRSPYVLVAHSIAGMYARLYAYTYPEQVAGMVLVDSVHEEQEASAPAWLRKMIAPPAKCGPLDMGCQELLAWPADRAEGQAARRARGPFPLGHMPLVVLTAGHHDFDPSVTLTAAQIRQERAFWLKLQNDLAHLSSNSRHIIALDAGHGIPSDQPDIINDAIHQVIIAVRRHSALAPLSAWLCGSGRCP